MAFLNFLRIAVISTLLFTSVNGACNNPKVRQEWRSISSDDRAAWLNAIKCLAKLPHDPSVAPTVDPTLSVIPPMTTNSSYYDDFVYTHMDLNVEIHQTGFFFPWHRLFVQTLQNKMEEKCGYTGVHPYWDWTKDTSDPEHATVFSNDTTDGLGWWGDANNDYQINTGALKDITVAYPVPHHIRRNLTLQPFLNTASGFAPPAGVATTFEINNTYTTAAVNVALDNYTGNYTGFQSYFENIMGPHPGPHIILGGDMSGTCPDGLVAPACVGGQKWSPNDPFFFLHHAMVDRVWWTWQNEDPSNKDAFAGGSISIQVDPTVPITGGPPALSTASIIPGDGLLPGGITVEQVLDTEGDYLCYTYE